MVYLKKNLVIFLAVLFAAALFSPPAFVAAGTGLEEGDGSPPHGVTSEGDAYGTKLYGVASVAMPSVDPLSGLGAVSYIIRLRNKKELHLFRGEAGEHHYLDIPGIQEAVVAAASADILTAFGFESSDSTLQLKSVDEYMDGVVEVTTPVFGVVEAYAVMDVIFAAK